ncbi:MAG: TIGR00730 family Rossman fold protein [Bacteroidaceae bacterium]|nr:TIGR00730 family Rossman fold protein [Bacteroidaceae bacterium]
MNDIKSVAVYCASSTKIKPIYYEVARQLGRGLALRGVTQVNGAGNMGLMQAASDAALEVGGKVIGVIPSFMIEQNWHHTGLTQIIETQDMESRKQTINDMTDAAIVLPGGCGTLDELFEIITLKQLGVYLKPIIIMNIDGYYDYLLKHLERSMQENFMRDAHRDIWRVATTAEEAIDMVFTTPLIDESIRRFAKI